MRTIARETAFQIVLGNCSKEAGGRVSIICDFSDGEGTVKHTCWQRLAASHEEQMSPLMILVLF